MNNQFHWQCEKLENLNPKSIYELLKARQDVFVLEQQCFYEDIDTLDYSAWHLIGWMENKLAVYARLLPPDLRYPDASFGRVLTVKTYRRTGLGRMLMQKILEKMQELFPNIPIRISAQEYLESFYQEFGFTTVSEPYLEDEISHVEMLKHPSASAV